MRKCLGKKHDKTTSKKSPFRPSSEGRPPVKSAKLGLGSHDSVLLSLNFRQVPDALCMCAGDKSGPEKRRKHREFHLVQKWPPPRRPPSLRPHEPQSLYVWGLLQDTGKIPNRKNIGGGFDSSRFLGRGCDEALFSEEKVSSVQRGESIQWMRVSARISSGKAIQWRGPGHSVNRRTLKKWKVAVLIPFPKISSYKFRGPNFFILEFFMCFICSLLSSEPKRNITNCRVSFPGQPLGWGLGFFNVMGLPLYF